MAKLDWVLMEFCRVMAKPSRVLTKHGRVASEPGRVPGRPGRFVPGHGPDCREVQMDLRKRNARPVSRVLFGRSQVLEVDR